MNITDEQNQRTEMLLQRLTQGVDIAYESMSRLSCVQLNPSQKERIKREIMAIEGRIGAIKLGLK